MDDTIVTLRFRELGPARHALHELEKLDRSRRLQVRGAALVQRSGGGGSDAPPAARDDAGHDLPPGGSFGMLLDAPGGLPGVLFAKPTEGFHGHGGHPAHEGERELALEEMSRSLEPGVTLVVAEIADPDPDVLQAELARLGGVPTWQPARDVYARIQAADEAEQHGDGMERLKQALEHKHT